MNEDKYDQRMSKDEEDISIAYDGWTYFLSWWMQCSMDETKDRENEGYESYSGR